MHSRHAGLLSVVAAAAVGATILGMSLSASAASIPFATFNKLTWAPDGSAFALEMSSVALDVSATSPVRVETVIVDPLGGHVRCASPRVESFTLDARGDSVLFSDACGVYIMDATGHGVRQLVWRQPASDLYARRYSQEHGYRVDKQQLLWETPRLRTPDQFQNWTDLVACVRNQLYLARPVAEKVRQPWESNQRELTPQQTRRAMPRILAQLGTPARRPKRRGNSPGRKLGAIVNKAPRYKTIYKASGQSGAFV